jgi:hypothetical protein
MEKGKLNLIPDQTSQKLEQLYSGLTSEQASLIDKIKNEILSNLSQYERMADFRMPVKKVEAVFLKHVAHHFQQDQIMLKRALVAKLALKLPGIVKRMNLPPSILELYPDAFGRLADFLQNIGHDPYDSTSDFFCKDIRFVLGLSVPCCAQIVDMHSMFYFRTLVLSCLRSKDVSAIKRYFLIEGYRAWFQIHTESRYLDEFNEHGWDRCYLRVAELLKRKKDITGMVGTSWFYDPQLLKISPRLAYLQSCPQERGAFFLRHGSEQSDIAMAIKTSETRRRLYQEGKYIPVCYSMLWPRKELIAWAEQMQQSISSTDL